jgi:hypothetical protein
MVLKFAYNMKVKLSFYVLVKKKKTQFYITMFYRSKRPKTTKIILLKTV